MLFEPDIPHTDYFPHFLTSAQSKELQKTLLSEVPWEQLPIHIFGKSILQPRLQYWMSDPDIRYRYSGLDLIPNTWHPNINALRLQLQDHLDKPFNSVLLNYYRNGQDYMGWHSDDEVCLGKSPCIASISLGAERTFAIKANPKNTLANQHRNMPIKHEINLQDGSLLIMRDQFQQQYLHALPKRSRTTRPRWNLTFRHIISER